MAFAEVNGVKLAYDTGGEGDPPIVFVHGWSCDRTYFAPQLEHFGRRHAVVTVDLRGHGDSDQPEAGYEIEAFADDVLAVAAAAGAAQPVVVGHSMGGVIALAVAARPGAARAAVMVDPAPLDPQRAAGFTAFAAQCRDDADGAMRRRFCEGMFLPTDVVRRDEIVAGMSSRPAWIAAACVEAMAGLDGRNLLRRVDVPLLSIGSAVPSNSPEFLRAHCPSITTGQTVGAGHFNQLEVPDQVNAMIGRFLAVNGLSGA